jgi:hypothetical protein
MIIFEEFEAILIHKVDGYSSLQKILYMDEVCVAFKARGYSRTSAIRSAQAQLRAARNLERGRMSYRMRLAIRQIGYGDGGYINCDGMGEPC